MGKRQPRSKWKPWIIIGDDGVERRYGRCFRCARYLGVTDPGVKDFVHLDERITIGDVTLEPGWYCPRCLEGARRLGHERDT